MFEYEFRIFGLRRLGNHSLIHLICSQFPDHSVYYYNDIQYPEYLFSHHSYKTSYCQRPIHSDDIELMGDLSKKLVDKKEYELKELIKPKERLCLIQSYEDQDLKKVMDKIKLQKNRDPSKRVFNIIVIRDYRNWLASRLKAWRNTDYKNNYLEVSPDLLNKWEEYLNEATNKTSFLKDPEDNKSEFIVYHFNRLMSKPKCRTGILKKLGLFKTKISWNTINNCSTLNMGKGSSFINNQIENNGKKYNERWKLMKEDTLYHKYLSYKENRYCILSDSVFTDVKNKLDSSSHIPSF